MSFKHLFTGVDNETLDLGRIGFFIGLISYIYFTYCWVSTSGTFNMQDFGVGFGSICVGAGGLLKLKENTEPGVKE